MKKREIFVCAAVLIAAFFSVSRRGKPAEQTPEKTYDYTAAVERPVVPTAEAVQENDGQTEFSGTLITDHSHDQKFLYADGYDADSAYSACLVVYQQYGFQAETNCEYVMETDENGNETPVGVEFVYIGDRT